MMRFKRTKDFIFTELSKRIDERIKKQKVSVYEIVKKGQTNLYQVIKYAKGEYEVDGHNTYLIQDSLINGKVTRSGEPLYKILKFKSNKEMLWGTDKEIRSTSRYLFTQIFLDLYDNVDKNTKYKKEAESMLMSYSGYAMWSYFNEYKNDEEHLKKFNQYYTTNQKDIEKCFLETLGETINFLFLYPQITMLFYNEMPNILDNIESYSKLDNKIDKFVKTRLIDKAFKDIKLMFKYDFDIGERIRNIFDNDIILITNDKKLQKIFQITELPHISIEYANKLIELQRKARKNMPEILDYTFKKVKEKYGNKKARNPRLNE